MSASALLDKLIAEAPFRIEWVQVDGRAEFEQACQSKGIRLYVLPPKRPQLNVERAHGSWRYEFYATTIWPAGRLDKLQILVDAFRRFNHHRPHDPLYGLTPAEYLQTISAQTPRSHMC